MNPNDPTPLQAIRADTFATMHAAQTIGLAVGAGMMMVDNKGDFTAKPAWMFAIHMSPTSAKQLAQVMAAAVEQYEARHGTIYVPVGENTNAQGQAANLPANVTTLDGRKRGGADHAAAGACGLQGLFELQVPDHRGGVCMFGSRR